MDPKNSDSSIETIGSDNHIKIKIKKKFDQLNNELTLNQNIYPKIIIKIKPSTQTNQIETDPSNQILQSINDIPIRRKRIGKWTLPLFLERARKIHGNKYDYSQIKEEDIKGARCNIPLKCNTCFYE